MASLGPRAAVTLPAAAAALVVLFSLFLLRRRRSRTGSEGSSTAVLDVADTVVADTRNVTSTADVTDAAGITGATVIAGTTVATGTSVITDATAAAGAPVIADTADSTDVTAVTSVTSSTANSVAVTAEEDAAMRLKGRRSGPTHREPGSKGTSKKSLGKQKSEDKAPETSSCCESAGNANGETALRIEASATEATCADKRAAECNGADSLRVEGCGVTCPVPVVLTVDIPVGKGDAPEPAGGAKRRDSLASPSGSVDSLLGRSSSASPLSATMSPQGMPKSGGEEELASHVASLSLEAVKAEVVVKASVEEVTASAQRQSEPEVGQVRNNVGTPSVAEGVVEEVAEEGAPAPASDVATHGTLSFSDAHSEGSSDSGKGGSDIHGGCDAVAGYLLEDLPTAYEFELPRELCGRLIGAGGRNVAALKERSNASVYVHQHPFSSKLKLCTIEGTTEEIRKALEMIRKKFPLSTFPAVTLTQVNAVPWHGVALPETLQLRLPDGVTCDVVLTSMVTAGHFFLQQPTHPTYPSLARLDQYMQGCYGQGLDTPPLPQNAESGIICAAQVYGGWYRALVVGTSEEECDIKFLDYGGYMRLATSLLRQIRSDFMMLPFQASECYLANVHPAEEDWSPEACATFEDLAQGQILQALIVGYAENGIPLVHLYRVQGVSSVFINRELVSRGVARWVEHTPL